MGLFYDYNTQDEPAPVAPPDTGAHFITNLAKKATDAIYASQPKQSDVRPAPFDIMKAGTSEISDPTKPKTPSITGSEIRRANSSNLPNVIPFWDSDMTKQAKPIDQLPWYLKPGRAASDVIRGAVNDLANRTTDAAFTMMGLGTTRDDQGNVKSVLNKDGTASKVDASAVERMSKVFSVGLGGLNVAFTPVTAGMKGAEDIPLVGTAAKLVNTAFTKVGEVGNIVGTDIIDKLPVQDKTKEALKPVVGEMFGLLAQIGLGKIAHDTATDKQLATYEQRIKKIMVESEPIETQIKVNTPKTKMADYSKSQGYEGYTPPEQLPTIEMGKKPAAAPGALPTIDAGAPEISNKNPKLVYEPIPERPSSPTLPSEPMAEAHNGPFEQSVADVQSTATAGGTPSQMRTVTPVEGAGPTRTRGLAQGVEESAVRNKLVTDLGDLPQYQAIKMADQAKAATDLVNNDYASARDVAMGRKSAPDGVLPESVFVAVEERATREGDVSTLRDLATNSKLVSEATTMGQRIRTLAERGEESPVAAISELAKAREAAANARMRDLPKSKRIVADEIQSEIRKVKPSRQNWEQFIDSIRC